MFCLSQRMQLLNRSISKNMNIVAEICLHLSLLPDFQRVLFLDSTSYVDSCGTEKPLSYFHSLSLLGLCREKKSFSINNLQGTVRMGSIEITAA